MNHNPNSGWITCSTKWQGSGSAFNVWIKETCDMEFSNNMLPRLEFTTLHCILIFYFLHAFEEICFHRKLSLKLLIYVFKFSTFRSVNIREIVDDQVSVATTSSNLLLSLKKYIYIYYRCYYCTSLNLLWLGISRIFIFGISKPRITWKIHAKEISDLHRRTS